MSSYGSFGYHFLETSHFSSLHINDNGVSGDIIIVVSAGDGRLGFRSQDTSHSSSRNCGVYCHGGRSGDDGRVGYMSQDTSHSFYFNFVSSVYVDGGGVYRSQTSQFTSHNPGGRGIFLGLSFSSCTIDEKFHGNWRVGYRSNANHSPSHNLGGCGRLSF